MKADKLKKQQVLHLADQHGILRPRDLVRHGISPSYLARLYHRGYVEKIGRGLYTLPKREFGEDYSLAQASKQLPNGVICLLTALRFHKLTTQIPHEVWIAINSKARHPVNDTIRLRLVWLSGKVLTSGVDKHRVDGVEVRIFNPAKTVADCFKFRNKIGIDVAIEALRDCRSQKKCTIRELLKFARICRVEHVIKPYLEATA